VEDENGVFLNDLADGLPGRGLVGDAPQLADRRT
jgi:hypothetical protein